MTRTRLRRALAVIIALVAAASASPAAATPRGRASTPPATRIAGRIVDDHGNPLAGVIVHVESAISYADWHTARTDASGRYTIRSTPGPQDVAVDGSHALGGDADAVGYVGRRSQPLMARYGRTTSGVDITMHPAGAVRGTVTDPAGHPLDGVVAWLAGLQPYVYSDSYDDLHRVPGTERVIAHDGVFRIAGVRPGAYLLCFDTTSSRVTGGSRDRVGYESSCGSDVVAVAAGQVTRSGATPLALSSGGVVFGRVTSRAGQPVANVVVDLSDKHHFHEAVTGPDGWYRIADISTSPLNACFRTAYVHSTTRTGFAPACGTRTITVAAGRARRLDQTLASGGAISGVAHAAGGAPLAGVIVDGMWGQMYGINDVIAETDDAGRYLLKNLPSRVTEVCFSPDFTAAAGPGVPFGAVGGRAPCPSPRPQPGRVTTGADATFPLAGAISGVVRDQNGKPLPDVEIDLEGNTDLGNEGEFYAYTNAAGRYTAVDLPPVKFMVCYSNVFFFEKCYRRPGAAHPAEIKVRAGQDIHRIDATLSTEHNHVTVAAVDSGGHPLPGAEAVLFRACSSTTNSACLAQPAVGGRTVTVRESDIVDAHGRVTWPAVRPGSYTVCVFGYYAAAAPGTPGTGYGDACDPTPLTVATSGNPTVRVSVPSAGAVTGQVTDAAGRPLAGVRVHISGSAADDFADPYYDGYTPTPRWDAYTDANGDYTIRSVAPGAQTACFDPATAAGATAYQPQCLGLPPGSTSGGDTVAVTAGATTTGVDISLSPQPGSGSPTAAVPGHVRTYRPAGATRPPLLRELPGQRPAAPRRRGAIRS